MKQKLLFLIGVVSLIVVITIRVSTSQLERQGGVDLDFKTSLAFATNPTGCYSITYYTCDWGCGPGSSCWFTGVYGPPTECMDHQCGCIFQPRECVLGR